jgi:GT2 family glycosyltransferase
VAWFLQQALYSVQKAILGLDAEVWVVDNASSDHSIEMVKRDFPQVKLIASPQNLGFSKANNLAIWQCRGEYVLLLNPDTLLAENTLQLCLKKMDTDPIIGGLGVHMIDGSGNYLPESKRGFPSPWVAFCKTFGLSKLFPNSRVFNRYHLGYLSPHEDQEVDVLSGAFMLLRKSVLDQIGLLDEQFFMYGEDIDLSYRIQKAAYKNIYLAGTKIIHYKGESTKKGSLNYVRVFYQAMILFARKHFQGAGARGFVLMLQLAIYFRAVLTLLANLFNQSRALLLDLFLLWTSLLFWKNRWGIYRYDDAYYFDNAPFYKVNMPLYLSMWVVGLLFSGTYRQRGNLQAVLRGMLLGAVGIASVYGFLDQSLRSSRMLILLGTIGGLFNLSVWRALLNLYLAGHWNFGQSKCQRLAIVGNESQVAQVQRILEAAQAPFFYLGRIEPEDDQSGGNSLGNITQLDDLQRAYQLDTLVFCAETLSNQQIIERMALHAKKLQFKIMPPAAECIIGSHSKNESGELYTLKPVFAIDQANHRFNKRGFDLFSALLLVVLLPFHFFFVFKKRVIWRQCGMVLLGKKTWIGYSQKNNALPVIKPGVLTTNALSYRLKSEANLHQLDFAYARNYSWWQDFRILYLSLVS